MRRARRASSRGRSKAGDVAALARNVSELQQEVEQLRLIGRRSADALHPSGLDLEIGPTTGASVDDEGFGPRSLKWFREASDRRVAYIQGFGNEGFTDTSMLELAAEEYAAEDQALASLALTTNDASRSQASLFMSKGGTNYSAKLLDELGGSDFWKNADARVCAGAWSWSIPADPNFRFFGAGLGVIYDPHSMLAADGILFLPVAGRYFIQWHMHTIVPEAHGTYVFKNSVNYMSGIVQGSRNDISGHLHWGNDGLGHIAPGCVLDNFSAGEHVRFGGWHIGGGSISIRAHAFRIN